jgi:hypothetical protein
VQEAEVRVVLVVDHLIARIPAVAVLLYSLAHLGLVVLVHEPEVVEEVEGLTGNKVAEVEEEVEEAPVMLEVAGMQEALDLLLLTTV